MSEERSAVDRVLGAIVPRAVGAVDADALISDIDVDAVVARVDLDALVARLDVDALIQRVDVEALLQRIDVDGLLDRIDVARLIDRIDVDGLIRRVDLEALLAEIDVDGLIARIDLDALVARLDVDALVARLDVDALVARLDVDALVNRLDVDALIRRVDVAALVSRAGIDDIVSQAATGVATRTLDLARRQVLGIDTVLLGVIDRVLRRPRLGARSGVTGRPAGPVARALALTVDWVLITFMFGLTVSLGGSMVELFTARTVDPAQGREGIWALVFLAWAFTYIWASLAVTGRTIGKALVGLRVLSRDATPIGAGRAALRTALLPLSLVFVVGLIPAVVGRERRALHDLGSGSKEVVDWGGRNAALPSPLGRWLEQHAAGAIESDGPVADGVSPAVAAPTG